MDEELIPKKKNASILCPEMVSGIGKFRNTVAILTVITIK